MTVFFIRGLIRRFSLGFPQQILLMIISWNSNSPFVWPVRVSFVINGPVVKQWSIHAKYTFNNYFFTAKPCSTFRGHLHNKIAKDQTMWFKNLIARRSHTHIWLVVSVNKASIRDVNKRHVWVWVSPNKHIYESLKKLHIQKQEFGRPLADQDYCNLSIPSSPCSFAIARLRMHQYLQIGVTSPCIARITRSAPQTIGFWGL
jgi:hypothetical protein